MSMLASGMNETLMHTVIANGGIMRYVTPGALDGFAAGALLSSLILLVVVVPRILRRQRQPAAEGTWSRRIRRRQARPDYFATPVDGGPFAAALSSVAERTALDGPDEFDHVDSGSAGYQSKHRMAEAGSTVRRPEARRGQARHAAPSGLSSRISGRSADSAMATRG